MKFAMKSWSCSRSQFCNAVSHWPSVLQRSVSGLETLASGNPKNESARNQKLMLAVNLPCQGEYADALRSATWGPEVLCIEVTLETLGHRKSKNSKLLGIKNWIHHWIPQVKASSDLQEFSENVKFWPLKIDLQISDLVLLVLVLVSGFLVFWFSGPCWNLKMQFPGNPLVENLRWIYHWNPWEKAHLPVKVSFTMKISTISPRSKQDHIHTMHKRHKSLS